MKIWKIEIKENGFCTVLDFAKFKSKTIFSAIEKAEKYFSKIWQGTNFEITKVELTDDIVI